MAQINKVANLFWEADPIAQMQYEHDSALEQLKEGRKGYKPSSKYPSRKPRN